MYFYAKIKNRHPLKATGTQCVRANSMGNGGRKGESRRKKGRKRNTQTLKLINSQSLEFQDNFQ